MSPTSASRPIAPIRIKAELSREATEFHNIGVRSHGRSYRAVLQERSPYFVEGRIQTRSWEGKEDGKKQYRTEIVVDNFQFGADGKTGTGAPRAGQERTACPKG